MLRWFIVAFVVILAVVFGLVVKSIESLVERQMSAGLATAKIGTYLEPIIGALEIAEVKRQFDLGSVVFVDARSFNAFHAGHIPGALHVSYDYSTSHLRELFRQFPTDTAVIAYCANKSCMSSHEVASRLVRELGFANVKVLAGGWPVWAKAGYPIASGTNAGG